jgi:DNA-binding Xre family transcriptional regulator
MPKKTKNFNELRKRPDRNTPERRANVAEYRRAIEDAIALGKLRESRNVTQVDLAAQLGITQGSVSRMEGRSEIYLSTLRSYIEALGGHLEIAAVFGEDRVPVAIGARNE